MEVVGTHGSVDEERPLAGGVANAGAVVRQGDHVLRPSNPHTDLIHRFLRCLHDRGFEGASPPVGVDADGRERLEFIDGDVALPPYPAWVQTDEALASIARLLRRCHDVARSIPMDPDATWSDEMADREAAADPAMPGLVICHNDVCLENVVFRGGVAIGLLDWDFAAPGRPLYDLAQFARMCVPVDDPESAARLGWAPDDRPRRLRVVADAYGLDEAERATLLGVLDQSIAAGGAFVRRRVEAGDANFIRMWDEMGGATRFERRRRWWAEERDAFLAAL